MTILLFIFIYETLYVLTTCLAKDGQGIEVNQILAQCTGTLRLVSKVSTFAPNQFCSFFIRALGK